MLARVGILVCSIAMALPAMADELIYDFSPTTDCLAEKGPEGEAHQCFGAAANACMEATPGGWSTVGMSQCLRFELEDWDLRLNRAYGMLMTRLKVEDEEMALLGSSAPEQAPALLAMQRAWTTFRDASCDYERSQWGGGTGGGPAATSCHLFMTARQAWSLEADLNAFGEQICNHEGC